MQDDSPTSAPSAESDNKLGLVLVALVVNLAIATVTLVALPLLITSRIGAYGFLGVQPQQQPSPSSFSYVELSDRAVSTLALVVGASIGLSLFVMKQRFVTMGSSSRLWLGALSFVSICGAVVAKSEWPDTTMAQESFKFIFGGFGVSSLVVVVVAIALLLGIDTTYGVLKGLGHQFCFQVGRNLVIVLSVILVGIFYLPAQFVFARAVPTRMDWGIVLADMVGPSIGNTPILETYPYYHSLLGWPLVPLSWVFRDSLVEIAVVYVSVLLLVVTLILAQMLRMALPHVPFLTLVAATAGVLLYRPWGSIYGSLQSFPSFAVRHLLPLLAILIFVRAVNSRSGRGALAAGLVTGLAQINNFEAGIVLVFTLVLVTSILFFTSPQTRTLIVILWTGAVIVSAPLVFGGAFSRLTNSVSSIGTGVLNVPMPRFGLQYLTLSSCAIAIALGFGSVLLRPRGMPAVSSVLALTLGLYASNLHIFYYSGRSVVGAQLQSIIPLAGCALTCAVAPHALGLIRALSSSRRVSDFFLYLPAVTICALPALLLTGLPNPSLEAARLSATLREQEAPGNMRFDSSHFRSDELVKEIALAQMRDRSQIVENVGFIATDNGNVVQLLTGATNLLPFDKFNEMSIRGLTKEVCSKLASFRGTTLVIGVLSGSDLDDNKHLRTFVKSCLATMGRSFMWAPSNSDSPLTLRLLDS